MWYSEFYNGLLDHQYVSLGIQYYLLARVGSRFPFNPVSGSLYHLGFELMLKSYLRKKYSGVELQKKFWHSLEELWKEFKLEVNDSKLARLDTVVKNLDSWEKVRYIELKGGKNAHAIEIVKGSAPTDYLNKINTANLNSMEYFRLYVDDMDELFKIFFLALQVPPEELLKIPDFCMGKNLYEQDNKHSLFS